MSARKKRLPLRRITRLLNRHLQLSARGKAAFARSGDVLDDAVALGVPLNEPITLPGGEVVMVEDQFAEGNKAYAAKLFQRYKVKPYKGSVRASGKRGGAA